MKKLKSLLCALLTTSILLLCIPVNAETIQATFNTMILNINGQKINEKGQNYLLYNGDQVPFSIVYKGTTYLPLRKLVELLGQDLTLDGATSTVYIKNKDNPVIEPTPAQKAALVTTETIDATFNVMILNINGLTINEKGQNYTLHNGDQVPFSMVYKGTTYLPLRKLVELLGKELTLYGETSTVYITDKVDSSDYEINWADPAFEGLVRKALNKPTGKINRSDLDNVTNLYIQGDYISFVETTTKNPTPAVSIKSIGDVIHFKNLTRLTINDHQLSDVGPLSQMADLEYLMLYNNRISDISPLSQMENLRILLLNNNQINDISTMSAMANLSGLSLSNNYISDISPLSKLTKLNVLFIDENQISDITSLSKLTKLNFLFINKNQINDITPLSDLTNLTKLIINKNKITNIKPLEKLAKLTELHLSSNNISDISPLSSLESLSYLTLLDNPTVYANFYSTKESIDEIFGR